MILERMGETVTLEMADGTQVDVSHVLTSQADLSDQTVQDVQTRFINQARYKGDQSTLNLVWPKSAPHDVMDGHVWVRGERYRVYGQPFAPSYSPVGYDCILTVTRSLYLFDVELGRSTLTRDKWGAQHATWEWTPVKGNLLRLAEDDANVNGTYGMSGIVMFEFTAETWGDGYEAVRYPTGKDGSIYHHKSSGFSQDVVLCTFSGGVNE